MSINTLQRSTRAKYCKNHSIGNKGFSLWPTINAGQYNGSRILPGLSSTSTPFKGDCPKGTSYVDRYGRGGYKYNSGPIIYNCGYYNPCYNEQGPVKNTSGLLSNKLVGTRFGKKNTVKQYVNNNIQSEYIENVHKKANGCFVNNLDPKDFASIEAIKNNCDTTSIIIGNGKQIIVGNYVKTGALANKSLDYEDYNTGILIKNNCLNNVGNSQFDLNTSPQPLVTVKDSNGKTKTVSSNMKNSSSFRNICP